MPADDSHETSIKMLSAGVVIDALTLYLLVSSADNLCKQFGPRSGSKLFDTLIVFLKEFFLKVQTC